MPYFHAVALFEGRGFSFEETNQAVAALFASISHRRLHYYEHETTEGPHLDGAAAYFVIFADFDVEAYTEEKASDLVDEVLDAVSTSDLQYFSHGLLSGQQRGRSARRAPVKNEQIEQNEEYEQNEQNERDDQDEGRGRRSSRGGRRRGTRGRGRGQADEASVTRAATDEAPSESSEAEPVPAVDSLRKDPVVDETASVEGLILREQIDEQAELDEVREHVLPDESYKAVGTVEQVEPAGQYERAERDERGEPVGLVEIPLELDLDLPAVPPVRSSSAMQTKTAVTIRASELGLSKDMLPSDEDLIALAATEACRRHPALPADTAPEAEMTTLPWGDVVLTLTWSDDVPVPSADDGA